MQKRNRRVHTEAVANGHTAAYALFMSEFGYGLSFLVLLCMRYLTPS